MTETGQWNAMRFAQNPLPQPSYNFANVPKACRDLTGSVLQHVDDRENLKVCMAEMLLLCKEAMRRRPGKGTGSKPLSLEYLAREYRHGRQRWLGKGHVARVHYCDYLYELAKDVSLGFDQRYGVFVR
jgi:hypothetical protein